MKTSFLCLLLFLLSCRPVNQNSAESDSADGATVSEINTELESPLETIRFQILINASPEIVYNTMTNPEHFKTWTATFQPTSHYKGDWKQGSIIHFLSLDEEGNTMGLMSRVRENAPHQRIILEHFGLIHEGKEITEGEEVEAIKGAIEQYSFVSTDGQTALEVKTDIFIELKDYFEETWPKALQVLKQLCENQATQFTTMAAGDWKDMLLAVQEGDLELVKYHLDQGVNPNYQHPEFLTTPLIESISLQQFEIAAYLLENGADPALRAGFSLDSPLAVAKQTKNKDLIKLVKSHLPKKSIWRGIWR